MGWSNPFRSRVVYRSSSSTENEPHIPWILILCLLIMGLVVVVLVPLIGIQYLEMNNATNAAIIEVRKMKELRLKLLLERQGE